LILRTTHHSYKLIKLLETHQVNLGLTLTQVNRTFVAQEAEAARLHAERDKRPHRLDNGLQMHVSDSYRSWKGVFAKGDVISSKSHTPFLVVACVDDNAALVETFRLREELYVHAAVWIRSGERILVAIEESRINSVAIPFLFHCHKPIESHTSKTQTCATAHERL
jgi:hypothetical protein